MTEGRKKKRMVEEQYNNEQHKDEQEDPASVLSDGIDEVELLTVEEINALKLELDEAKQKVDEYLDGWQRARAEFANYKKRVDRDLASAYQNASGSVLKRFLEIIDDLERALKNKPAAGEIGDWVDGIDLVYRKFMNILEQEGITVLEAEGKEFDPNQHEAISYEEVEGIQDGRIIEVLKQGYQLGERILRPAAVRVAKRSE